MTDLVAIARSLVSGGKGILAADESVHTADKRLESYGITPRKGSGQAGSEEMRRAYRDLFLEAPGIEEHLSGVILFAETFEEQGNDGKWFPQVLKDRGVQAGIKVDLGLDPFPGSAKEFITTGLIGLPERFKEFKDKGATFAKWRAAFPIDGDRLPTTQAIHENAKRLAKYAREAQEYGLVPIVEPEVLHTGKHSRKRAREVIEQVMQILFSVLEENSVDKASLILKTSMALSGDKSGKSDTPEEVAEDTIAALMQTVPRQVAGIVFLSGGQSPEEATANLKAIHARALEAKVPWPLTFSYARALQDEALTLWKGEAGNVDAARHVFLTRLAQVAEAIHI